jgi:hypothetical protein
MDGVSPVQLRDAKYTEMLRDPEYLHCLASVQWDIHHRLSYIFDSSNQLHEQTEYPTLGHPFGVSFSFRVGIFWGDQSMLLSDCLIARSI